MPKTKVTPLSPNPHSTRHPRPCFTKANITLILSLLDSHRLLDEWMKEQMDTRVPVYSLDPVPSLLENLWCLPMNTG